MTACSVCGGTKYRDGRCTRCGAKAIEPVGGSGASASGGTASASSAGPGGATAPAPEAPSSGRSPARQSAALSSDLDLAGALEPPAFDGELIALPEEALAPAPPSEAPMPPMPPMEGFESTRVDAEAPVLRRKQAAAKAEVAPEDQTNVTQ